MTTVTFHVGDVRDTLAAIPDGSVNLIVTSPPFLALRSYLPADHPQKAREIGSEPTPPAFLDTLLELTAEWRRVLHPSGSIAVEIGDTYSGSGGAGGDYTNEDGFHAGQPVFRNRNWKLSGLLAKSLCGIPTLYTWSLAYGRNLLTGTPSPAGQWRIRNLLVWTRPNPPVGALGDKFRPATSYVTVACVSDKRWFDLDAVRTEAQIQMGRNVPGNNVKGGDSASFRFAERVDSNPAGAPPLDWHDDWQPLHRLPTQPFSGWAETVRHVRVPTDAGADGSQRTTSPDCPVHGSPDRPGSNAPDDERADGSSNHNAHNDDRLALKLDAGSPPTSSSHAPMVSGADPDGPAATRRSKPSNRTGHDPATNPAGTPSVETPPHTGDKPTTPLSAERHHGTPASSIGSDGSDASRESRTPGRIVDTDSGDACSCSWYRVETITERTSHYATFPLALPRKLIEAMCPQSVCAVCGEGRRRIVGRTDEYAAARATIGDFNQRPKGSGSVSGSRSVLVREAGRDITRAENVTLGWSDCGHDDYRPGRVLDPFGGSGTTAVAAALTGRNAILCDLDERNVDLTRRRLAEHVRIHDEQRDGDTIVWTVEPATETQIAAQAAGQAELFDEGVA